MEIVESPFRYVSKLKKSQSDRQYNDHPVYVYRRLASTRAIRSNAETPENFNKHQRDSIASRRVSTMIVSRPVVGTQTKQNDWKKKREKERRIEEN